MKNSLLTIFLIVIEFNSGWSQNKTYNINDSGILQDMEVPVAAVKSLPYFENAEKVRVFNINPSIQSNAFIKINDTILLDLFAEKHYKGCVDKINLDINGTINIRARLVDCLYSYCIISTSNGKSSVLIDVPDKNEMYLSRYDQKTKNYFLLQIDKSKQKALEDGPTLIPPFDNQQVNNSAIYTQRDSLNPELNKNSVLEKSRLSKDIHLPSSGEQPEIITLLIVYTPSASAWADAYEGGINNTISLLMAKAQLALDNSNTFLAIQLVHSEQINYVETNTNSDLYNLTNNSDGYMDNVHSLRDTYCADLVVLLENTNFTGGLGWLYSGSPSYGFSLTRVQQASWTYTTIHEIGHNMGCHHHKLQNFQPGPGLYSYSAGWRWTGNNNRKYCSVMTYESGSYFSDGITHTRLGYFSNPDIQFEGIPTGLSSEADNAKTIRQTKSNIASYRNGCATIPTVSTSAPTANSTSTATCGGNVLSNGGSPITAQGVCWSTNIYPTVLDLKTAESVGASSFSSNISGLAANTTYHVRAYAVNTAGAGYGSDLTFTTPSNTSCHDLFEPNDEITNSNTTAFGSSLSNSSYNHSIYGTIDTIGDWDIYRVNITNTGTLALTLNNIPDGFDLQLYDEDYNYVAGSLTLGNEEIVRTITLAGYYYIIVGSLSNEYSCSEYTLSLNWSSSSCLDSYEPNDDIAHSNITAFNGSLGSSAFNKTINGTIHTSGDWDIYRINFTSLGTLSLTLSNIPDGFDLQLYDSNYNYLAGSFTSGNEEIVRTMTSTGYYYLIVGSLENDFSCSDYMLSLNWSPSLCIDIYEPNDAITNSNTSAFNSSLGSAAYTRSIYGTIHTSGDWDHYRIYVTSKGILSISLNNVPDVFDLQLYDENHNYISGSFTPGNEEIVWSLDTNGYYYIIVGSIQNAFSCNEYLLSVNWTPIFCKDGFEPNNSLANSNTTAFDNNLNKYAYTHSTFGTIHNIDDLDHYRINITSQGNLRIILSNIPDGFDLQLYDENFNYVTGSSNPGNEEIQVPIISTGYYYIIVRSLFGEYSCSEYNLTLIWTPPSAPIIGAITQPNCIVTTGSVVLTGLPATGNWILTRFPDGITTTGSGANTTVIGLVNGTYTFTVTDVSGYTSDASNSVVINPPPLVPNVPSINSITQPSCNIETGSVELNDLPLTGTWILFQNPDGLPIPGTGTSITISGLNSGNYTYRVINSFDCTSLESAEVVINSKPETPLPPVIGMITQPSCAIETGSVELTGLPATGNWTLTNINLGTIITGTGAKYTTTGLLSGNYNFTITNADGCSSIVSENVVINTGYEIPKSPSVGPITQPSCLLMTGSVFLYDLPERGNWSLTRTPDNIVTTGEGPSVLITGLTSGTYSYTVTNDSSCISGRSENILIENPPPLPAAPTITLIGNVLESDAKYGNQWYDQNGIIEDSNDQFYNPITNGIYYAIVTLNGCSSVPSNLISFIQSGIESSDLYRRIEIYPNPVSDEFIIEMNYNSKNVDFEIINSLGKTVFKGSVFEKTNVQTTNFPAGIYLIKFDMGLTSEFKKIIKK